MLNRSIAKHQLVSALPNHKEWSQSLPTKLPEELKMAMRATQEPQQGGHRESLPGAGG